MADKEVIINGKTLVHGQGADVHIFLVILVQIDCVCYRSFLSVLNREFVSFFAD